MKQLLPWLIFVTACGGVAEPARPDVTDAHGRRYSWLADIPHSDEAPPMRPVEMPAPSGLSFRSPGELSDEELAEAFRPIMLLGDRAYIATEPNDDFVKQALLDAGKSGRYASSLAGGAGDISLLPMDAPAANVWTPDYRWHIHPTTNVPWQWIMAMQVSAGVCSAVGIGPNTVMTAAHCFYSWYEWNSFQFLSPGFDALAANTDPFGRFNGVTGIWFPSCWYDWPVGENRSCDYAVIDFSMQWDRPSWHVGWMGWWWNAPDSALSNLVWVFGYADCPDGAPFGTQCGTVGSAYHPADRSKLVSDNIPTGPGDSGTGWFLIDGDWYWLGDHIGPSEARFFDGTVHSFLTTVAHDQF